MIGILPLLIQITGSNSNSNSNSNYAINSEPAAFSTGNQDFFLPIALIVFSIFILIAFYSYHLHKVIKNITAVTPMFDMGESEIKMEFTIAERGSIYE